MKIPKTKKQWTAWRNREMAKRVANGSTVTQVAKEFGCSVPTARAACTIHGVKPRRGRRTGASDGATTNDVIRVLGFAKRDFHASQLSIARSVGVSQSTVGRILVAAIREGVLPDHGSVGSQPDWLSPANDTAPAECEVRTEVSTAGAA